MADNKDMTAKELRELLKQRDEQLRQKDTHIQELEDELHKHRSYKHRVDILEREKAQWQAIMESGVYTMAGGTETKKVSPPPTVPAGRARGQGISAEPSVHLPATGKKLKHYTKPQQ